MKQLTVTGGRQRPKYRLSPNEVEQLKKEETERRRKLRIVQVREQSKMVAAHIRQNVKQERKKQLVKLAHEIENELDKEKEEEVRRLERQYDNTLRTIGQGHTQAILTDKETCHADRHILAYQNQERAQERHQEALRKVALDKAYKEYEDTKHLRDRQAALTEERKRAAEVAARPPPPPDPITEAVLKKNKLKRPVPLTDMNAFSSTHYHVPDFAVEKAPLEQQHDGKMAGEEEDLRTKEETSERRKREHDQVIRARIRGNEALKKEKLKHEYDALMADLSLQQRADRRQRQLVVARLPKQVFIPPDRRMEELEEKQTEMERAFEDMYMKQMNLSGDLSLTLDPNPLPQTPADDTLEAIEDSPVVIPTMPAFNPALRELTNVSGTQGQTTQQGKPETVLKKLLQRIKDQRSEPDDNRTPLDMGSENIVSEPQKNEANNVESDFSAVVMPPCLPSADPQLDLSPHKVPGNQKPRKSPVRDERAGKEEEEDSRRGEDGGEAGFLQQLQHRLQAIEVQKDQLDRKMRERQQQKQPAPFPAYTSGTRPQPSGVPLPTVQYPASSSEPQGQFTAPTSWYSRQPSSTLSGGPAGDVGVTATTCGVRNLRDRDIAAAPDRTSMEHRPLPQTYTTSLSSQSAVPALGQSGREGVGQLMLGSGQIVGQRSQGSAEPALAGRSGPGHLPASQRFSHSAPVPGWGEVGSGAALSSAGWQGGFSSERGFSAMRVPGQLHPTTAGLAPSVGRPTSWSAGYGTAASGVQGPLGGLAFQPASSVPPSSAVSQSYSTQVTSLPASQPSRNVGEVQAAWTAVHPASVMHSSKPVRDPSSLARSLESVSGEEERLRKLREYQQQLIVKHQERMKALQEVRTSIETRQAQAKDPGGTSSLAASQRGTDPASMVPYTLKTSLWQSQSSTLSSSSAPGLSSVLPCEGASQAPGASRLAASAGPGPRYVPGAESSVSARAAAPVDDVVVAAAVEPILAGSSGVPVTQEMLSASATAGTQQAGREGRPPTSAPSTTTLTGEPAGDVCVTANPGTKKFGGVSSASKLDSVRKSLPFDDLDESQGQGGGDTDGASMANDSQLSSSTERGSPALGSRSNKSSTSGSGLSAMSDGSLGGSSLVARAEEKRLSFEQRQRELQDQLAEIQRQKDALLQRYHGNQLRVSAQEETLRSKLKTAQASSSSVPASLLHHPPSTAVSLGVHQSASPSLELEERSLSSERLSTGHSWAMELEEYSLSNRSPASMTLEEVSITSQRSAGGSGGREGAKITSERSAGGREGAEVPSERSAGGREGAEVPEPRPGSSHSSLQEPLSTLSRGRQSTQGEDSWRQPTLSVKGSQENLPARRAGADSTSLDGPDSGRGRLDIRDLLQELGEAGEGSGSRGVSSSWSGFPSAELLAKEEDDPQSARLPPPAARQPAAMVDYEPHELSTILEVDTPQTGNKTTATRPSLLGPPTGAEGTEKSASRRYIDFGKHGTATEDDRDSKFSASGSSASSDVRSVIEVRTGILKSGETTSATGSGDDTSFSLRGDEKRFRENILESSSMKGTVVPQGAGQLDPQLLPSQEVSYASSGQVFQSLELTLDSLTPRSVSVEESQARRYLDFSSKEPAEEGGVGGKETEEVLKQARQFNKDLMAAIQRQSADVFDQSSLSSVSQSAADQSRSSQQCGQNQTPQL